MPTLTYTFPVQRIDPENTLQLIIVFNHTFSLADFSYTAEEKNLRVEQYGKLEMQYDLEDAFLVPGKMNFTIGDADGVLDEDFFGADTGALTEKQAKVTLKLNGTVVFIGNIIEDSIDYDTATMQVKFDAAPQLDIINKRMVYDEAGVTALNPLGLTSSTYRNVVDIIEKIYQLVNASISYPTTLTVIHDWEFFGIKDTAGAVINDIVFEEILQLVDPLFFDNSYGISTVGDVLRKLAVDWCSFTGFISYDKAFFKKLFHYDAANLQTVYVHGWRKGYRYGLIDYVKLTTGVASVNEPYEEGTFTELQDRFINKKTLPGFWVGPSSSDTNVKAILSGRTGYFIFVVDGSAITTFPVEGDTYTHNSSTWTVIGVNETNDAYSDITFYRSAGSNDPTASGTLTRATGSGDASIAFSSVSSADGNYDVYQTRDPNIISNAFSDHGDIVAKFWYHYRGNIANCRVDKFVFKGINYDFLKDFNYSGFKFQPIGMTFHFTQGFTECEAIYLGEL